MKRNKKNEELERFLKSNPNLGFFEAKNYTMKETRNINLLTKKSC